MKGLAVVFSMLICSQALCLEKNDRSLNFVVPAVVGLTSVESPRLGELVYDATNEAFYGFDQSGNWQQLSSPVNIYQESKQTSLIAFNGAGSCTVATQFCDLGSITLAAGEWDITGQIYYFANGTVTTTNIQIGISSTSGNSSVGLEPGNNSFSQVKNSTSNSADPMIIANYRVLPTVSTTYYLKGYAANSITNLQVAYRISARRIK